MEKGVDPEIRQFFIRIAKSVSLGLSWLMACFTAGFYFKLAYTGKGTPVIAVVAFYLAAAVLFGLLFRYLIRLWKK